MNMMQRDLMDRITDEDARYAPARELPDAFEAEQAMLGAILMNNDAMDAVPPTFSPEFLGLDVHRKIYQAMTDLRAKGKRITLITLKSFLNDVELIKGLTVSQYLAKLVTEAVNVINVDDFAWAATEASVRRGMVSVSHVVTEAAYNRELSLMDEIDAVRSYLDELHLRLSGADGAGVTGADAFGRALARVEKSASGHDDVGIDCGFEPVRQLIGHLTPGQLIIIGGATKQGKSGLARQIGLGAARNGFPCMDYSGEMDADELAMRELARITRISVSRQKEGNASPQEINLLRSAKKELEKLPWQIIDRRRTLPQFAREFKAFAKRHRGQCVGIVDSVTLFDTDRSTQRLSKYEFAEYATDSLKALGRDTGCPIIALAQLKKNTFAVDQPYGKKIEAKTYRNVVSRRPRASDLFGACERDADHVLIPFNPMPILEEIEPPEGSDEHVLWEGVRDEFQGNAQIILALSRERRPSRRDVRWDGETTSFLPKNEYAQERMF